MDKLNSIEYGFKDKNGNNLINSERWDKDFYKFYFLLSPEELLSSKCGVCWDQVELERKLFNDANIDCDTYFIYIDDNENLPSHTFLTFQLNDKYYAPLALIKKAELLEDKGNKEEALKCYQKIIEDFNLSPQKEIAQLKKVMLENEVSF